MDIFQRNYNAVVKRGLIKPDTTIVDFIVKLKEEKHEVIQAFVEGDEDRINEELADCAVVCLNALIHRGVNIEEILTQIAIKNENR